MLGKRLKRLRTENKMTQRNLAEVIGVTHVSISGYESGKRTPDTETLTKLADYFNVSTDYLLGRESKSNLDSFEAFLNDPELETWYRELPESDEEELRQMKEIWEIIKKRES